MTTLKRGTGMTTFSTNWNSQSAEWIWGPGSAPDSEEKSWDLLPVFVPNGKETYVGDKTFSGQEFCVFKCLDDSFLAQPKSVCLMPVPTDPMKVLSVIDPKTQADKVSHKVLFFEGANWKLCGDKKWQEIEVEVDLEALTVIGGKSIFNKLHRIAKYNDGFIAFP